MHENRWEYDSPEQIKECLECKAGPDCNNCARYKPKQSKRRFKGYQGVWNVTAHDAEGNVVAWYPTMHSVSEAIGISEYRIRRAMDAGRSINGLFYSKKKGEANA